MTLNRPGFAILTALLIAVSGCAATPGGTSTDAADFLTDETNTEASEDGSDAGTADGDGDGADGTDGDSSTDDSTDSTDGTDSTTDVDGPSGTVNFYVSDRPMAMDDFRHLNVTITSVQFHLVEAADTSETDANETDANETMAGNETANGTTAGNQTTTETNAEDGESEGEKDEEGGEAGEGDGRWVTRDVSNVTVDLTELRGENATLVEAFDLPAGEYDKVFLQVGNVEGTLKDGSDQRVKLPSNKLQLNKQFVVGNGEEVNFVYDISVHKAGNSGKYILKPVVGESGADQEFNDVGEDEEDEKGDAEEEESEEEEEEESEEEETEDEEQDEEEQQEDEETEEEETEANETEQEETEEPEANETEEETEEADLSVEVLGDVEAGNETTVAVTNNGTAVPGAMVWVNGERVGETNGDGEITITVPADAEELELEVKKGDAEAELTVEITTEDDDSDGEDG
jgi:hypothetical protein